MMLAVAATEVVDAPLEQVWEFAGDTSRYAEWVPATLEVTRTDGPARAGSTYDERNRVMGPIRAPSHWTVTEYEPMRRQVHRDESVPFFEAAEIVMEFEAVGGDATRVTLAVRIAPGRGALGALGRVFGRLMAGSLDENNRATLRNLKVACEQEHDGD